ncbi:hypothetical protein FRACYDRAFT_238349 [Fragilariopsis cylindrus CCMP1102]|uniref:Uncharacterized protein n=1 Tax=Fragilariopsis cylindrus CCMP1102 TaxID=635003 RepID=A0A1E7FIA9_9STRA|nr:hypothetical protein FRACYDRAFT_238349 [Fragilariopsis cylindrus CCMP1102]|eukprot:OEU17919.1 hypothetical protein FRACYDRAFT_238349 [Fragilariopsis cylindrus CCMP1102]
MPCCFCAFHTSKMNFIPQPQEQESGRRQTQCSINLCGCQLEHRIGSLSSLGHITCKWETSSSQPTIILDVIAVYPSWVWVHGYGCGDMYNVYVYGQAHEHEHEHEHEHGHGHGHGHGHLVMRLLLNAYKLSTDISPFSIAVINTLCYLKGEERERRKCALLPTQ